ncbi:hypothetical protein C4K25_3007 [Pseudomonas chlororaphis]|jgi:hypothetical protein|nr:hypothetical protein C4K25_3007 [Pseudomonas chlororaphis]
MRRFGFACLAVAMTLSIIYVLKPAASLPPTPHVKHPVVSMTDIFRHL